MKSLSISLIRRLRFHKFRPILPSIHLNYISDAAASSSSSSSSVLSSTREISTCCRTYGMIVNKSHFRENQFRNLNTHVEEPTEVSSGEVIDQEKIDLEEAFESAKTTDEMVRFFKEMELSFEGSELVYLL